MIVDHRIYESIYALAFAAYVSSLLFVGHDRMWRLLFGGSLIIGGVVGCINLLDWIWS